MQFHVICIENHTPVARNLKYGEVDDMQKVFGLCLDILTRRSNRISHFVCFTLGSYRISSSRTGPISPEAISSLAVLVVSTSKFALAPRAESAL